MSETKNVIGYRFSARRINLHVKKLILFMTWIVWIQYNEQKNTFFITPRLTNVANQQKLPRLL